MCLGRSICWYNNYENEIAFSRENGFDFMQVWYQKGKIIVDTLPEPREAALLESDFPIILHAVFDLDDFEAYGGDLIRLTSALHHHELIVHPVCKDQPVTARTSEVLSKHVGKLLQKARQEGITLYLENNSVIDGMHHTLEELSLVHGENPDLELLLDLAHIDSYAHLEQIVNMKFPKCLHVADKRFSAAHEHLPLGQGDLDFPLIFSKYLKGFDGRIIMEVIASPEEMAESGRLLAQALKTASY